MADFIKNTLGAKFTQAFKPSGEKGSKNQEIKDTVSKGEDRSSLSDINALSDFAKNKGIGDLLGGLMGGNSKMDEIFDDTEKAIEGSSGDMQKDASKVTKNLLTKIQDYAKSSGKKIGEVVDDVEKYAVSHPAVSITVLLGAGITAGALLEHYNVPGSLLSGAETSLSAIKKQIKEHPFIAGGIGLALAGGLGYLTKLALTSPAFKPPVADTPEKQKLDSSLDKLEKEVSSSSANPDEASKGVAKKFFDTVGEYAKATGKAGKELAGDVKDFMLSHPGVSASVILGAGVATGVLLEKAGVPEKTAFYTGLAFDCICSGAKKGMGEVTELIKENPVLSGVLITGLVAGTGYLVYDHFSDKE